MSGSPGFRGRGLDSGKGGGVSRCTAMMLAKVFLLPMGQANEACEKDKPEQEQKS